MTTHSQEGIERAIFRFRVGAFDCMAVNDGTFFYTADQYFSDAPPDVLTPALEHYGVDRQRIPSPYTCLLVDTGVHVVAVDTGGDRPALRHLPLTGGVSPDIGHFHERLTQAGRDPRDVDHLIVTHAHPDHIGGNTDCAGAPFFPNARVVIRREEWEYWTSETNLAAQPSVLAEPVRRHLLPLADRVELLEEDGEIVPGICALHAPGHTPGHMALAIRSEGEELLYISDAALHPLHLEHPAWNTVFELDPGRALHSRRALFDRAAADDAIVLAFHFHPSPGLGHVRKRRTGWTWHPLDATG